MTELPAGMTTDVSEGNNLNIPVTSATPIVTEVETMEADDITSFLDNCCRHDAELFINV